MLETVFSKVAGLRDCNFIKKKLQHFKNIYIFIVIFIIITIITFVTIVNLKNSCICLDCNMISCEFQLNFVFFLPAYIFVWSFSKLPNCKRTQNLFITTRKISDILFIFDSLYICIYSYLHFLIYIYMLTSLHLFTLIYLSLCSLYAII